MGRAGNVARMGAWRDVYTILVGDAWGKGTIWKTQEYIRGWY
jgi:hypothetical protein